MLVKATLVLLAGLAVARLAVRARASVRHLVVASSFLALVALPLVIAFVPAIAIEVPAPAAGIAPLISERRREALAETPAASDVSITILNPSAAFCAAKALLAQWIPGATP